MVSTFSLQQAWRGGPQILEFAVIPGADAQGVRLIVNEIPYTGPASVGRLCEGFERDPATGETAPQFAPVMAGPQSFVLADQLEFCRISFLTPSLQAAQQPVWKPQWRFNGWPLGIRIEMAPLHPEATRLQPIAVTAALHLHRAVGIPYVDF